MSTTVASLEEADRVDWGALPQPDWNNPTSVPTAIRRLASASGEDDSWKAYNQFLFAIGNNHAGTYYPIALPVLPFLACILRTGSSVARQRVLDILIDLSGSFEPAPGHEFIAAGDESRSLRLELQHAIGALWSAEKTRLLAAAEPHELALATQLDATLDAPVENPPARSKT